MCIITSNFLAHKPKKGLTGEKMKKILFFLAIWISYSNIASAASPWPGEAWTDSANLTSLDSDFQANLSGAHWNESTQTLWVCLNGPGRFWALVPDGRGNFEIDSQNGRAAEWSGAGDFEGITQVNLDEPFVYIMAEGEDNIKKFDVSVYGSPVLTRQWNISRYVPTSGGSGSEGITFVPDKWLRLNGFVDGNGVPTTSQNGMGGLMFVAHQNGGSVYVFDLDPNSNNVNFVGAYKTLRSESSGLEFDRSSGKLYIWHNIGSNFIEITDMTSFIAANGQRYFSSTKEYQAPKGGNLEGIALTPATSENSWFFITDDSNQNGAALMWFDSFEPEVLGNDEYETYQNTALTIAAPGLLENDLGTDDWVVVDEPLHGTLENLSADGSFTYRPHPGYVGSDTFTYSAIGGTEVAKVQLTVKPVKTMVKFVATSIDDVEQRADGTMYSNSSDLELVQDGTLQTIGLRFRSINIPKDATILKATLQFTTDEINNGQTHLILEGEASGNASEFSLANFNVSGRPKTASNVSWEPAAWGTLDEAGAKQQTPDMTSIVQEILNGEGWQEGNAMVFIITGTGKRVARSFDINPALAPKLIIEYTDNQVSPVLPEEPEISSIDVRISADIDDVEQRANGSMYSNSTDIELVTDGGVQTVGLRFRAIDIPQGSEIIHASIQFTVDEISSAATQLVIRGENSANAGIFTTTAFNVTNRVPTLSSVDWVPPAWNVVDESGESQKTPDLAAVVQEIIDNPAWQNNASLVFIISGSGVRTAESFTGSANQAALLHVEYR